MKQANIEPPCAVFFVALLNLCEPHYKLNVKVGKSTVLGSAQEVEAGKKLTLWEA